jgi:threonine dehydratase
MPLPPVTLSQVEAAAERIRPYVHRTPVLTSRQVDAACGLRLHFKCEIFQRVGAFKARGAFSRDRKSTRLNSSHNPASRMPSSA